MRIPDPVLHGPDDALTQPIRLPGDPAPRRPSPGVLIGVSAWRLVIVASALYGFSDATGWTENLEGLSQQASLLTGVVYTGLLLYPAVTGGARHEPRSPWVRGATAVLLLLVAGTFFGIMGGDLGYLPFEHVVTPLLVLVDWVAVGRNQAATRWWHPLTWVAFPLAYLVFFLVAGVYRSLYEFLDPRGDTFAVVVVGLLVGVIAIGYLLLGVGRLRRAIVRGGYGPAPATGRGRTVPRPPPDGTHRRLVVAAAVAAAVAVVGTVGGLLLSSGGGGLSGARAAQDWATGVDELGAAEELWRIPQGPTPGTQAAGDHWVTDTHLVRRLPGRVVAYELATGAVAWELPLPGDPEDDCASSPQQSGTRVALLRAGGGGERGTCGELTVVDIGTGSEVFTTEIPPIDRTGVTTSDVPVAVGDHVLVGSRAGGHLFNIETGKHVAVADDGSCREDAYALVDEMVVARVSCRVRPPGSDVALSGIRVYDDELHQQWQWQAPRVSAEEPMEVRSVLSVEPLVVELYRGDTDTIETVRVDRDSDELFPLLIQSRGANDESRYLAPCDGNGITDCAQSRIVDGTLVLTTIPEQINPGTEAASAGQSSTEFRNELVGIDVGTGTEVWRTGMVEGRAVHLVPTTDGSVVAYQSANANDVPGLLLSVDAATGAVSPLLPITEDAHEDDELRDHLRSGRFGGDNQQAVWTGEQFVVFRMVQRADSVGEVDVVAFG